MVGQRQLVSRNLRPKWPWKNCMKTVSSYKLLNQRVKLNKVKLTDFQKQSQSWHEWKFNETFTTASCQVESDLLKANECIALQSR